MAFINSQDGAIDVDPNLIGQNLNAGPLFNTPRNYGNSTLEGRQPETLNASVQPGWLIGDWLQVPDDNLETSGSSVLTQQTIWRMADGSSILLAQDEFSGNPPFFHWSDTFFLSNARVRLTQNTLPGFVAYGIVTASAARKLGGGLDDTSQDSKTVLGDITNKVGDIAGNVVKKVTLPFVSLAVVALVVGAIWFLPKGTFAKVRLPA